MRESPSRTLFRASGRKLEKFTVSVNVAAGSKVTFELTYEELLKRHKGKYEMYLKVQPKQLIKHFEVINRPCSPRGMAAGCRNWPMGQSQTGVKNAKVLLHRIPHPWLGRLEEFSGSDPSI